MRPPQYHDTATRVYAGCSRRGARARRQRHRAGKVAAPGPGHSARDRSLVVMLNAYAPDGFVVCSHAGDDWHVCKDYVRERLGLPPWRPGDGHDRRVEPSRLGAFDRAAVDTEGERRERTRRRSAAHRSAPMPYGTKRRTRAGHWQSNICGPARSSLTTMLPAPSCAITRAARGATRTPAHRLHPGAGRGLPLDRRRRHYGRPPHQARSAATMAEDDRRMLGLVHRAAVKLDPAGEHAGHRRRYRDLPGGPPARPQAGMGARQRRHDREIPADRRRQHAAHSGRDRRGQRARSQALRRPLAQRPGARCRSSCRTSAATSTTS